MNRPVAARAIFLTSLVLGLAVAASVLAAVLGRGAVALGLGGGSGIALLCGLSWLLGVLVTFDGPMNRLLKATLGVAPVRFVFALGAVSALAVLLRGSVDMVALGTSFAATHFLLQLVEADTFMKLADASSKYPPAKPVRFGGLRLW